MGRKGQLDFIQAKALGYERNIRFYVCCGGTKGLIPFIGKVRKEGKDG